MEAQINNSKKFKQKILHTNFISRDHLVHGINIIPGVTYLDIIYRMAKKFLGNYEFHLSKVLFKLPLATDQEFDQELEVVFNQKDSTTFSVSIWSQKINHKGEKIGVQLENMSCYLKLGLVNHLNFNFQLTEFTTGYDVEYDMDDVYKVARSVSIDHYQFMKTLGKVYHKKDEEVMALHLSELSESYRHKFYASPAFLDGATFAGAAFSIVENNRVFAQGFPYIPFSIDEFCIYDTFPSMIYVHSKKTKLKGNTPPDIVKNDLVIFDQVGKKIAEYKGLTLKKIRNKELIKELLTTTSIANDSVMEIIKSENSPTEAENAKEYVREILSKKLNRTLTEMDENSGFYDIGLTSKDLLDIVRVLETKVQTELYPTLLFEYTNIHELAEFLGKNHISFFKENTLNRFIEDGIIDSLQPVIKNEKENIISFLKSEMKNLTNNSSIQQMETNVGFYDLGLTSKDLLDLVRKLEEKCGHDFYPTLLFEYSTIDELADFLFQNDATHFHIQPQEIIVSEQFFTEKASDFPQKQNSLEDNLIAVVGIGCRFPKASNLHTFWDNLRNGVDGISEIPFERWAHDASENSSKTSGKWGGFIEDIDMFDPFLFNQSPLMAEELDPQTRIFLQTVWSTVEDAGYAVSSLKNKKIGVFAGSMFHDYPLVAENKATIDKLSFYSNWEIANRVSYHLGITGPSVSINNACSSSLTAIIQACDSILKGECEQAIAGGVNLLLHDSRYKLLGELGLIGDSKSSKSFNTGNGYLPGEGAGSVLLKPLKKAIEDGDHIYGAIRSGWMSHDGSSGGFGVPSVKMKTELISDSLRFAQLNPSDISYIECAANGSPLGDPIEIKALSNVFQGEVDNSIVIGSVKSNLGHLEAASGVSQLTKVLLQLKHKTIVPSIGISQLNKAIPFENIPFKLTEKRLDWNTNSTKRRAMISSFGVGGSNANLIVEEVIVDQKEDQNRHTSIIPLSSTTEEQIKTQVNELIDFIENNRTISIYELAFTLQVGRDEMKERVAFVAQDVNELLVKLKSYENNNSNSNHHRGTVDLYQLQDNTSESIVDTQLSFIASEELAKNWIRGVKINWIKLYRTIPSKISLPTYPFLKERCWISETEQKKSETRGEKTSVIQETICQTHLMKYNWQTSEITNKSTKTTSENEQIIFVVGSSPYVTEKLEDLLCQQVIHLDTTNEVDIFNQVLLAIQNKLKEKKESTILFLYPNELEHLYAFISGLFKTIQLETPKICGKIIGLDSIQLGDLHTIQTILHDEKNSTDVEVKYSSDQRFTKFFSRLTNLSEQTHVKENMVYLITGGAGKIGQIFSNYFSKEKNAICILVGRSDLDLESKMIIDQNPNTYYYACDISHEKEVSDLVNQILQKHGEIKGIIHAAGVIKDRFVVQKQKEEIAQVFAAKIKGIQLIDEATRHLNIDFMVLFSSISGVLGNIGQADYASANNYLDHFANYRNNLVHKGYRKGKTVSISWPYWQEGGMQINPTDQQHLEKIWGMRPMPKKEGIKAFEKLLNSDTANSVVIHGEETKINSYFTLNGHQEIDDYIPVQSSDFKGKVSNFLKEFLSENLKIPITMIQASTKFESFGIDSMVINKISSALDKQFGKVSRTIFFECQNLSELTEYFSMNHRQEIMALIGETDTAKVELSVTEKGEVQLEHQQRNQQDIAIIGLSSRYPGAKNVNEFWEILKNGTDCISEIPKDRWELNQFFDAEIGKNGKSYSKWGGFIDNIDQFDPLFFKISPKEAKKIDPQERLFLECAWEAIEDAGYTPEKLQEVGRTLKNEQGGKVGVFVGCMNSEYQWFSVEERAKENVVHATSQLAAIPNRVSYYLDLHGPSMAIDTMCSSSLTALSIACNSIKNGECEMAIAGGVNLILHPQKYIMLSDGRFVSSNGKCESFGEGAEGYVPAEGVGAVILKPLAQAEKDGDQIYGVIKGVSINHGGKTNGFTVPNPKAQRQLIKDSLHKANIKPEDISYVEAHGTGTKLGDPIEINALVKAFESDSKQFCSIGSVKSNIGHCESAAGISGLTKVLLQLKHQKLVPSLHSEKVNPEINFTNSPFIVQQKLEDWKTSNNKPRRAFVSSFGAGGSNANIIIEEYQHKASSRESKNDPFLLTLSAKNKEALVNKTKDILSFIASNPEISMAETCYTLQVGREAMNQRLAITVHDQFEAIELLKKFIENDYTEDTDLIYQGSVDLENPIDTTFNFDLDHSLNSTKLSEIARSWVKGQNMDWTTLYPNKKMQKISLPTYPFQRSRFWVETSQTIRKSNQSYSKINKRTKMESIWNSPQMNQNIGHIVGREIEVSMLENGIAIVKMLSKETSNMFTPNFINSLQKTFYNLRKDPKLKVVVLTGYDKIFCMGGSEDALNEIAAQKSKFTDYPFLFKGLLEFDVPVISAIQGHAFGGGLLFGLYADIVFLSEDSTYTANFMKYGFTPGMGATYILKEKFGKQLASEMMFTAKLYSGEELKRRGASVNITNDVMNQALRMANDLALKPKKSLEVLKQNFSSKILAELDEYIQEEEKMHELTFHTDEVVNKIKTSFQTQNKENLSVVSHKTIEPVIEQPFKISLLDPENIEISKNTTENSEVKIGLISLDTPVETSDSTPAIDLTEIESKIKNILENVLHIPQNEISKNIAFSDLGLDSISGVEVIQLINNTFQINLEAVVLYDYHTIKKLSNLIGTNIPSSNKQNTTFKVPENHQVEVKKELESSSRHLDKTRIKSRLKEIIELALHIPASAIEENIAFADLGVDSISSVEIIKEVNDSFYTSLEAVILYDYHTINKLSDLIEDQLSNTIHHLFNEEKESVVNFEIFEQTDHFSQIKSEQPKIVQHQEGIAIIGMSGRFPKANNTDEFWTNLVNGIDCIEEVPERKWSKKVHFDENKTIPGKTYSKWLAALDDEDKFDAEFFNISPREAERMDPQQRLILEESYKAIEDAGYAPDQLSGQKWGAFVGIAQGDYLSDLTTEELDMHTFTGSASSILASRLSYLLDLQGPAVAIETACSSSLVAIHQACQSIKSGDCDVAIAGGVYVMTTEKMHVMSSKAGMLSETGTCKTFDQHADGFVPGEAVACLILKSLTQAEKDGDHIYGIVAGSGVNQDGKTNGITSPSFESQTRLQKDVMNRFQIDPSEISYVETHGTGTKLGDPIEIKALKDSFESVSETGFCALGSVKTNIGHTLTAAGIVSAVKVLLSIKHKQLAPSLHFDKLNEHISFVNSPFFVNNQLSDWKNKNGKPLKAAINSFGFSGTNAHVIIQEYIPPVGTKKEMDQSKALIILSAFDKDRLQERVKNMVHYLDHHTNTNLSSLAFTLQVGRARMDERMAVIVESIGELKNQFINFLNGNRNSIISGNSKDKKRSDFVESTSHNYPTTNLEVLAEKWVNGEEIDWNTLYEVRPEKLSLPTYPFYKFRHWYRSKNNQQNSLNAETKLTVEPVNFSKNEINQLHVKDEIRLITPLNSTVNEKRNIIQPAILTVLDKLLQEVLFLNAPIDPERNFSELGLDSVIGVEFINSINQKYHLDIKASKLYEHPNLTSLTENLLEIIQEKPVDENQSIEDVLVVNEPLEINSYVTIEKVLKETAQNSTIQEIKNVVKNELQKTLCFSSDISDDKNFSELGLDSILGVEYIKVINEVFDLKINASKLYEYPTIEGLSDYILSFLPQVTKDAQEQEIKGPTPKTNDIAVVGMGGLFLGAPNVDELWDKVTKGEIAKDLQEIDDFDFCYGALAEKSENICLDQLGFSEEKYNSMSRQLKLLFLSIGKALSENEISLSDLSSKKTGVFIGAQQVNSINEEFSSGSYDNQLSYLIPNKISFELNLKGPSEVINTYCTSAHVALHRAIQSIENGECDQAIIGGVNVINANEFKSVGNNEITNLLSKENSTKSFSDDGMGFIRSEGAGVLIIKNGQHASTDKNKILCYIKGTSVSHGGRGFSLEAPNAKGIKEAINICFKKAAVEPSTIDYVEAHGIANRMADAIELGAINDAYIELSDDKQKNWHVGSIKPSIGHSELASGIASLIKVIKSFQNEVIPGIAGLKEVNTELDPNHSLRLSKDSIAWDPKNHPRRAAINSYSVGGVNAHIILEENPLFKENPKRKRKLLQFDTLVADTKIVVDNELELDQISAMDRLTSETKIVLSSLTSDVSVSLPEIDNVPTIQVKLESYSKDETVDTIIIGAGISGLVSACYLAKEGKKVEIYEAHSLPGGYLQTYFRKGFKVEAIAAIAPDPINVKIFGKVFNDLNIDVEWIKAPITQALYSETGSTVILQNDHYSNHKGNPKEVLKEIYENLLPSYREQIDDLVEELYDEELHRKNRDHYTQLTLGEFLSKHLPKDKHSYFYNPFANPTENVSNTAYFPYRTFIITFYGTMQYYPKGGWNTIIKQLVNKFTEFGGKIKYNHRVEKFEVTDNTISHVVINGKVKSAESFLLCGAPYPLLNNIFKENIHVKNEYVAKLAEREPCMPSIVLTVFFEEKVIRHLTKAEKEMLHGMMFFEKMEDKAFNSTFETELLYVICPTNLEPSLSPKGDYFVATTSVKYISEQFWRDHKNRVQEHFLDLFFKIFPSLKSREYTSELATPLTMEKFTSNYKGAISGWAMTPQQAGENSLSHRTPWNNLFLAGHWVFPGPRIPWAMESAYSVKFEVQKYLKKQQLHLQNDEIVPEPIELFNWALPEQKNTLTTLMEGILEINLNEVEAEKSFIDYGFDSIKLMRVVRAINEQFEIQLKMGQIFGIDTFGEFFSLLKKTLPSLNSTTINEITSEEMNEDIISSLSEGQKGLWFTHYLNPNSTCYNVPMVISVKGRIENSKLITAFQKMLFAHPILCANFLKDENDELYLKVEKSNYKKGTVIENYIEKGETINEQFWNLLRTPFDLEKDNLVRLYSTFNIEENITYIGMIAHHIVLDGISSTHFMKTLMQNYKNEVSGLSEKSIPIEKGFFDFVTWEQDYLQSEESVNDLAFWKDQLTKPLPLFQIPCDIIENQTVEKQMGEEAFLLTKDELSALQKISKELKVNLSVLLLGIFKTFISKLTGEEDVLVLTPTAGRPKSQFEKSLGHFVNMMVSRSHINGEQTFEGYIQNLKESFITSLDHVNYPFPRIISALNTLGEDERKEAFKICYLYQNIFDELLNNDSVFDTIDFHTFVFQEIEYDFALEVYDLRDSVKIHLKYNKNLLQASTVKRYLGGIYQLIKAVSVDYSKLIKTYEYILPEEKEYITNTYNNTKIDYANKTTLLKLFENQVLKTPEKIALISGDIELTYRELDEKANQIGAFLRSKTNTLKKPISLVSDKCIEQVIAVLGILKSGGHYIPIKGSLPEKRINELIMQSESAFVLVQQGLEDKIVNELRSKTQILDNTFNNIQSSDFQSNLSEPTDLAYIIFTSGSTGNPKGVMIDHLGAVNTIIDINARFDVNEKDIVFGISDLNFDLSVYDIFGTFVAGATLIIPSEEERYEPKSWLKYIREQKITVWNSVPQIVDLLMDAHQYDPTSDVASLRLCCMSGDWIPLELPKIIKKHCPNCEIISMGGATEASIWSIYYPVHTIKENWKSIPYGYPLGNQEMYVLDKNLNFCPYNVPGDIYIGGVGIAKGYLNDEEKTKTSFIDHPAMGKKLYRTGDLGYQHPDGYMVFLGRKDGQVKINGFRVELGEIEVILKQQEGVSKCIVIALEDDAKNKRLVAFVVPNKKLNTAKLNHKLREKLPEYMVPNQIIELTDLPLTENGKVDVKKLKLFQINQPKQENGIVADKDIQTTIITIWKEQLKVDTINPEDNFFQLGGHSLLMMKIINKINSTFTIDLKVSEILSVNNFGSFCHVVLEKIGLLQNQNPTNPKLILGEKNNSIFEPFRLSSMQQAYWVGENTTFELGGIHARNAFEIENKEFELDRLEAALSKVIERHSMLRIQFLKSNQQQLTQQTLTIPIKQIDLRHFPEEEQKVKHTELTDQLRNKAFDKMRWPAFELTLIKFHDKDVIQFNISLLLFDGPSLITFIKDLFNFYNDESYSPKELGINFKEYINYEDSLLQSQLYDQAKQYWLDRIPTLPLGPDLPYNMSDVAGIMSHREIKLEKDSWRKLKEKSLQINVSPSILLCAIYTKVLSNWSRNPHFSITIMSLGRHEIHDDIYDVIGNFSKINILEVDYSEEKSFREEIEKVQNRYWTDQENNLFEGIEVLRNLNAHHHVIGKAAIPITFASGLNMGKIDESVIQYKSIGLQVPQVALDHQAYETEHEELLLGFDIVEDYFQDGIINDILETYEYLLKTVVDENWDTPFNNLLPRYQKSIIEESNATNAEIPHQYLFDAFDVQAKSNPKQVAIIDGEIRKTYKEIHDFSNKIANGLRKLKVNANEPVAIIMHKGWEEIPSAIGIMKAGGAYLPIDYTMPFNRLEYILQKAEVKYAIVSKELLDSGFQLPIGIMALEFETHFISVSTKKLARIQKPTDLAYIIFTSGSTGLPKGVMIDHIGALNTCLDINERYRINEHDSTFALSYLYFDLSVYDIFGLLSAGGKIVYPDHKFTKEPQHWIEQVIQHKITIWNSVPELVNMLMDYNALFSKEKFDDLRVVLMSGDWIPLNLPSKIKEVAKHAKIISLGGATEGSIWSIYYEINEIGNHWKSIPYGKALKNQTMHVLNSLMKPCPFGVIGDIYIGGIGVAKGYLKDEERTQKQFLIQKENGQPIYKTGDIGRILTDGNIEFLGREDFQVKVQGYRIEMGEIESVLLKLPQINKTVVDVKKDASGNNYLVAYIVGDGEIEEPFIREHLSSYLPSYMVPKAIAFLDEIPITGNGKVDRKSLPEPQAKQKEAKAKLKKNPPKELDKLKKLIGHILEIDGVQNEDNFFQLGGNSILAIRLAAEIENEFKVRISISELLAQISLLDLAENIFAANTDQEKIHKSIVPINSKGTSTPIFLIHPIGGSVFCYSSLSARFGHDQSVYAFQSTGIDSDDLPLNSIQEMAEKYILEMKEIQPEGPYLVGGWSFGGLISFEMTQQLEAMGEKVEQLFLIDSYFHKKGYDFENSPDTEVFEHFLKDIALQANKEYSIQKENTSFEQMFEEAKKSEILPEEFELPIARKLLAVFKNNCIAYSNYIPRRKISADTIQIIAKETSYIGSHEEAHIWTYWLKGNHIVREINGNHFTIFNSENIEELSDTMEILQNYQV